MCKILFKERKKNADINFNIQLWGKKAGLFKLNKRFILKLIRDSCEDDDDDAFQLLRRVYSFSAIIKKKDDKKIMQKKK